MEEGSLLAGLVAVVKYGAVQCEGWGERPERTDTTGATDKAPPPPPPPRSCGATVLATADLTKGVVAVQWCGGAPKAEALSSILRSYSGTSSSSSIGTALSRISAHTEIRTPTHQLILTETSTPANTRINTVPTQDNTRTIITIRIRDAFRSGESALGWGIMRAVGEACRVVAVPQNAAIHQPKTDTPNARIVVEVTGVPPQSDVGTENSSDVPISPASGGLMAISAVRSPQHIEGVQRGETAKKKNTRGLARNKLEENLRYAQGLMRQIDPEKDDDDDDLTEVGGGGGVLDTPPPIILSTRSRNQPCSLQVASPSSLYGGAMPQCLSPPYIASPEGSSRGIVSPARTFTSICTSPRDLRCGKCKQLIPFDGSMEIMTCCERCSQYTCEVCLLVHLRGKTEQNTLTCLHKECSEELPPYVFQNLLARADIGVPCGVCKKSMKLGEDGVESMPFCEGCKGYTCESCFAASISKQIVSFDTVGRKKGVRQEVFETLQITCVACPAEVPQAALRRYLPASLFTSLEQKVDGIIDSYFAENAEGSGLQGRSNRFKCPSCKINIETDECAVGREVERIKRDFLGKAKGHTVRIDYCDMGIVAAMHFTLHRFRCSCNTTFCNSCFAFPYHSGKTCSEASDSKLVCRYCDVLLSLDVNKKAAPIAKPAPPVQSTSASSWFRKKLFSAQNADTKKPVKKPSKKKEKEKREKEYILPTAGLNVHGPNHKFPICSAEECQERFSHACKQFLPCGHDCLGTECGTKPCIPCFEKGCSAYSQRMDASKQPSNEVSTTTTATTTTTTTTLPPKPGSGSSTRVVPFVSSQTSDEFCTICWAEPLAAAPCLLLACGHIVHFHCLEEKLSQRWPTPRISFAFMKCSLCQADVDHPHPTIQTLLAPLQKLQKELTRKFMDRMKIEGMANDARLVNEGGQFFRAPLKFAEHVLSYYMCYKCGKPYFGGVKRCEALADHRGEVREVKREELICGSCVDKTTCAKHGSDYIQFKCRYCCNAAVWFCWGTTHFCDTCHRVLPNPLTRCGGPQTCNLRIDHPPNGQEYALGCVACKFDID